MTLDILQKITCILLVACFAGCGKNTSSAIGDRSAEEVEQLCGPNGPGMTCEKPACTSVCEPVDTTQCEVINEQWVCPVPACTCRETNFYVQCSPSLCDIKCEKPYCINNCDNSTCNAEACPSCTPLCSQPHCVSHCGFQGDDCVHTRGVCHGKAAKPDCKVTCEASVCTWGRPTTDTSVPIACEAPLPENTPILSLPIDDTCNAPQFTDWGIVCDPPLCEVKCDEIKLPIVTCTEPLPVCVASCANPSCTTACNTPYLDPDTQTYLTPVCTTTCICDDISCTLME